MKIVKWVVVGVLVCGSCPLFPQSATLGDDRKSLQRFSFERIEMGVEFRIALYACSSGVANDAANAAFDRIHELNRKLSDYESASEVRQLCRQNSGQWHAVSHDLHHVLIHAVELSQETDGAFDVTVGHYTKLWRRARRRKRLPEFKQIAELSNRTGFHLLKVKRHSPQILMTVPDMRLDLGGIAKGYAVDEALRVLRESGHHQACVDGSGDIAVGSPPPGKNSWRIELASLRPSEKSNPVSIEVANCAVATSGDAFQAMEIGGRRYSHIINPRTGQPLTTPSSVTVVAESGMEADSLASAVSVLGLNQGLQLIEERKSAECFMVTGESGKTITRATTGFRKLRAQELNQR